MEQHDHPEETVIDAYIALCPPEQRAALRRLRAVIRAACPEAEETIRWQMPTYLLEGTLVQFASSGRHVDFYPGPSATIAFAPRLEGYAVSKNAIRLPLDKELDEELIADIVRFRARENRAKAAP